MIKRNNLIGMVVIVLTLIGVGNVSAQSILNEQMDERFNDNKLPYGWFTEGWKVDSTGVVKKGSSPFDISELMGEPGNKQPAENDPENNDPENNPEDPGETAQNDSTKNEAPTFDITKLMGGSSSYNYLMTPPLSVQSGEVLVFSAKKGEAGSGIGSFMGGDSDSTFVVERAVYGEHMWIKVADFTTELDSVYKTFTVSNTDPGEYRFRFRAGGNVVIDSVAGFHIDMDAPDIYPIYQKKNIQPIDLGVCTADTTVTLGIINTATGTLTVDLSTSDKKAYSLDLQQASVAAADTAKVNLTFTCGQAHEGRNSSLLTFKTTDNRVEEIRLPVDAVIAQSGVWTEDFNNYKMPVGWFTEGWKVDSTGVATLKQGGGDDMMAMFGGGSSTTYYLMTPPLTVSDVNDVLLFSAMKPGGGGGMDFSAMMGGGGSSSSFFIEKSVYGSGKWERAKDYSNALDTVFTTQWLSGLEPGEYRFRFVASDSIVIDSVAGFQIDMNAPDLYVILDSVAVGSVDYGMLRGDVTKTFTVINTATGTLGVNVTSLDETRLAIKEKSLSVAAGDSVFVDATMLRDDERQGEIRDLLMFMPTDERVSPQAVAVSAYIIKSDAWSEDFEYIYVVEDDTYPRQFPEGWSTTGWMLTQGGGDDMMAMFGGGGNEEPSWVAKTDSKEYEIITPRLQAKKGHLLRFTANIGGGGMMAMMSMFMGGGGTPSYLNLFYKRDADKDWTLYNTYFQSDTIVFKAPYSGFYRLKFMGEGVSLDDFYGFSLPKDSIEIPDVFGNNHQMTSMLEMVEGQTWNVSYDRKIAARDNGDGTVSPVAASVCLPYEFNIDDYYEPGRAKVYQMEYVDTIYCQFIFRELPDNLMEAGKPYMIVVSRDDIQFNAIDAKMTSKVAEGSPVYDFANWWADAKRIEVGTWNGTFDSVTGSGAEYAMRDNGLWQRMGGNLSISPFRSYIRANETSWLFAFRQNPDTYVNPEANQARGIVTRFYQQDGNGSGEVTEIPGLYYIGDINGNDANGIVAPTIHTIDRDGTHNYFDLQGRRLNGKPNKGIYIENGKKHVAR